MHGCRAFGRLRDLIEHIIRLLHLIQALTQRALGSRDTAAQLIRPLLHLLDTRVHLSCQILDLIGKLLHLYRHYSEAFSLLAGTRRLNRRIDRKDIGLVGNGHDLIRTLLDLLHRLLQILKRMLHLAEMSRNLFGTVLKLLDSALRPGNRL